MIKPILHQTQVNSDYPYIIVGISVIDPTIDLLEFESELKSQNFTGLVLVAPSYGKPNKAYHFNGYKFTESVEATVTQRSLNCIYNVRHKALMLEAIS